VGKVRSEQVKKSARELIRRFPDKFSSDFEENKKLIGTLVLISSPKLRNRIVGYLTRLIRNSQDSFDSRQDEQIE